MGHTIYPNVESDPCLTLGEWVMWLQFLIQVYGEDQEMYWEAGFNNVSMALNSNRHWAADLPPGNQLGVCGS